MVKTFDQELAQGDYEPNPDILALNIRPEIIYNNQQHITIDKAQINTSNN